MRDLVFFYCYVAADHYYAAVPMKERFAVVAVGTISTWFLFVLLGGHFYDAREPITSHLYLLCVAGEAHKRPPLN